MSLVKVLQGLDLSIWENIQCAARTNVTRSESYQLEDIQSADDYAEPGYSLSDSKVGVLFGNWNPSDFKNPSKDFTRIVDILEREFELEWSDEWCTCGDCGKAIRTSGDCYGWTKYYHMMFHGCESVCFDCIDKQEYLDEIMNDPRQAIVHPDLDPLDYGFESYNGQFENGWHPGQTDNPAKIAEKVLADGFDNYVFQVDEVRQFDVKFRVYVK